MLHFLVMILIGLDSDDRLEVVVYIYFRLLKLKYTSDLEGGYVDDFEDQS